MVPSDSASASAINPSATSGSPTPQAPTKPTVTSPSPGKPTSTSRSPDSPSPASPAVGSRSESGISADEAKSIGAFVGDFDAQFVGPIPAPAGSTTALTLANVGGHDDSYLITLEPASAGSVQPTTAAVKSGQQVKLTVSATGPVTVHVFSSGRKAPVADQPLP